MYIIWSIASLRASMCNQFLPFKIMLCQLYWSNVLIKVILGNFWGASNAKNVTHENSIFFNVLQNYILISIIKPFVLKCVNKSSLVLLLNGIVQGCNVKICFPNDSHVYMTVAISDFKLTWKITSVQNYKYVLYTQYYHVWFNKLNESSVQDKIWLIISYPIYLLKD